MEDRSVSNYSGRQRIPNSRYRDVESPKNDARKTSRKKTSTASSSSSLTKSHRENGKKAPEIANKPPAKKAKKKSSSRTKKRFRLPSNRSRKHRPKIDVSSTSKKKLKGKDRIVDDSLKDGGRGTVGFREITQPSGYLKGITATSALNGRTKEERDKDWRKSHKIKLLPCDDLTPLDADEAFRSVCAVRPEIDAKASGPRHANLLEDCTPRQAASLVCKSFWEELYDGIFSALKDAEENPEEGSSTAPRGGSRWKFKPKNFTKTVFWRFMAIILLLGVRHETNMTDVWDSASPRFSPILARIMGVRNFKAINAGFTRACAQRYYPLEEKLMRGAQEQWIPSQRVAVDETLLHYTGWFIHHHCIPRKPAKNGVKFIGLVDSNGYFYNAVLCKRKTEDGAPLPAEMTTDTVMKVLKPLPTNKEYHVFVDSWFTNEALLIRLKNRQMPSLRVTGSCSKKSLSPLWKVMDEALDEKRSTRNAARCAGIVQYVAAEGQLTSGTPFWAISVDNGRKKNTKKHLHYVSTDIRSDCVVYSDKGITTDEHRKTVRRMMLPFMKDAYDKNFGAEDRADQAGAATEAKYRSMDWRRVAIAGLLNLFIAQNARLLWQSAHPGEEVRVSEFVTRVAYDLADFDPRAVHELGPEVPPGKGTKCSVCDWWSNNQKKGQRGYTRRKCRRCDVWVCDSCMNDDGGHRHAVYVVETLKP